MFKSGRRAWLTAASRALLFLGALAFPCAGGASEPHPGGGADLQKGVISVFSQRRCAIVKVTAKKPSPDGAARYETASGFFSSPGGHVLTSAFVAYGADELWVESGGVLMEAEALGLDPLTTMSVIRVKAGALPKGAGFVDIDASAPLPETGSFVVSLSREMGLPPSPRLGILSGRDINFGDVFLPTVYARTDIPAVSGSIGGAAFDLGGKFIGMTVASIPATGGSFLLPARAVARIRDDILLSSEPVYGWFGLQAENSESGGSPCVTVRMVIENGPAALAGFLPGDVILEINSSRVADNTDLRNATFFIRPGETASFSVLRDGKPIVISMKVGRMDPEIIKAAAAKLDSPQAPAGQEGGAGK